MRRVELSRQIIDFVASLAPEPRRYVRQALRKLEKEQGNIKALTGDLEGFYRLRVRHFRIVFWYREVAGESVIRCEYAESRGIVYELFEQIASRLRE